MAAKKYIFGGIRTNHHKLDLSVGIRRIGHVTGNLTRDQTAETFRSESEMEKKNQLSPEKLVLHSNNKKVGGPGFNGRRVFGSLLPIPIIMIFLFYSL